MRRILLAIAKECPRHGQVRCRQKQGRPYFESLIYYREDTRTGTAHIHLTNQIASLIEMNRARKFNSRLHDNINKSCVPSAMAGYHNNIQLRINQRGGLYDNGRRHSQILREQVLNLNNAGHSQRFIANDLKTSRHFVSNVLRDYNITNSSFPKSKVIPQRRK